MAQGKVNIRGKEYETVAHRVHKFREAHPMFTIATEILFRDESEVVMVARISDELGRVIATGHAEEQRKSSQINQTSALENCETSAIGRALAAFGYGGTEFASANEVQNAIAQQKAITPLTGVEELVTPDRIPIIAATAEEVRELLVKDDVAGAYGCWESAGMDTEETAYFWKLIPDPAFRRKLKEFARLAMTKETQHA